MDKTNKQRSFSAALRLLFFSVPLNLDFTCGNKQGTQYGTGIEGEGRVSLSMLQRKSSRSSPFPALAPLSSVLPSSPTTTDIREVLSNIHTPPHLERLDNLAYGHK